MQQPLHLAVTQVIDATQQPHQGTEPRPIASGFDTLFGSTAVVTVRQQGQFSRCSRCSITTGPMGGISTNWRCSGYGSPPCLSRRVEGLGRGRDGPVELRADGRCPSPCWGFNPGPSLDGGLEELQELRPFCSSSWATRAVKAIS